MTDTTALEPPQLLTLAEVLPVFRISQSHAYQLIRSGRFPVEPVRLGNKILFRSADVSAFLTGAAA